MSLRCLRATAIALLALGAGCAQDFDALFAKGNPPVTDSGPNPGSDAAGGDSGTMSCGTNTACSYTGNATCMVNGSGCSFECLSGRCNANCNSSTCNLTCDTGTAIPDSGTTTCTITCFAPMANCSVTCPPGVMTNRCPFMGGVVVSCGPCDN